MEVKEREVDNEVASVLRDKVTCRVCLVSCVLTSNVLLYNDVELILLH